MFWRSCAGPFCRSFRRPPCGRCSGFQGRRGVVRHRRGAGEVKPKTIVFSDHRDDKLADAGTGLIRFEDWGRERPLQKQFLSLFPDYIGADHQGLGPRHPESYTEKLHIYVVEARFLSRSRRRFDLASLPVMTCWKRSTRRSSTGSSRRMTTAPQADPRAPITAIPSRRWCEAPGSLCIEFPLSARGQAARRHPSRQQARGRGKEDLRLHGVPNRDPSLASARDRPALVSRSLPVWKRLLPACSSRRSSTSTR